MKCGQIDRVIEAGQIEEGNEVGKHADQNRETELAGKDANVNPVQLVGRGVHMSTERGGSGSSSVFLLMAMLRHLAHTPLAFGGTGSEACNVSRRSSPS